MAFKALRSFATATVAIVAALFTFSAFAARPSRTISVNFGANHGKQPSGSADSGSLVSGIPCSAWINAEGASGSSSEVVAYDSMAGGNVTLDGTALSWVANTTWYTGYSTPYLKGYLDDGQSSGEYGYATVKLTGIPFESYNVIVYAITDTGNRQYSAYKVNGKFYKWDSATSATVEASSFTDAWGDSDTHTPTLGVNAICVENQSGDLTLGGYIRTDSLKIRGCIAAIQVVENEDVPSVDISGATTVSAINSQIAACIESNPTARRVAVNIADGASITHDATPYTGTVAVEYAFAGAATLTLSADQLSAIGAMAQGEVFDAGADFFGDAYTETSGEITISNASSIPEGYKLATKNNLPYVYKKTNSISIKFNPASEYEGMIAPGDANVGAYKMPGIAWNHSKIYTGTGARTAEIFQVKDGNGETVPDTLVYYYMPNMYDVNGRNISGRNKQTTGNGKLTYSYFDDSVRSSRTLPTAFEEHVYNGIQHIIPRTPAASATATANLGWCIGVTNIPYQVFDLYVYHASDQSGSITLLPVAVKANDGEWKYFAGDNAGSTVVSTIDSTWNGAPYCDSETMVEGTNYIRYRISPATLGLAEGESIDVVYLSHPSRTTYKTGRLGLAGIQLVKVASDGFYKRNKNSESTAWFAENSWLTSAGAAATWTNPEEGDVAYATINASDVPEIVVDQDVTATLVTVTSNGSLENPFSFTGEGTVNAPVDFTGYTGVFTNPTFKVSGTLAFGDKSGLVYHAEEGETLNARSYNCAGTVTKSGAGTVSLANGSSAGINIEGGTLEYNIAADAVETASGAFTGSGNFVKSGAGTLVLSNGTQPESGFTVNGGTLRLNRTSGSYSFWDATDGRPVSIDAGGTFDICGSSGFPANVAFMSEGARWVNSGAEVGETKAQARSLTLYANGIVDTDSKFGLVKNGYGETSLDLQGFTLTKTGSGSFILCNTSSDSRGKIVVSEGALEISEKAVSLPSVDLEIASGATNNVYKTFTVSNITVCAGATIQGTGKLIVNGDFTADGTVGEGVISLPSSMTLREGANFTVLGGSAILNLGTARPASLTCEDGATIRFTKSVGDDGEIDLSFITCDGTPTIELYNVDGTLDETVTPVDSKLTYDFEVSGEACLFDYPFNVDPANSNNLVSVGQNKTKLTRDTTWGIPDEDSAFDSDGNLYAATLPYLNKGVLVLSSASAFSAAVYATLPSAIDTVLMSFGTSFEGAVTITSGDTANTVDIIYTPATADGGTATKTKFVTRAIPKASSTKHLYIFVLEDAKNESGDTVTRVTIYIDGSRLTRFLTASKLTLGNGFQMGSLHGGLRDGETGNGIAVTDLHRLAKTDLAPVIGSLRMYDFALGPNAVKKLAAEFPYVSENPTAERTVSDSESAAWSSESAWTFTGVKDSEDQPVTTGDAPLADMDVTFTAETNVTVDVNLVGNTVQYASLTLNGPGSIKLTGSGAIQPATALTVNTLVTNVYGAADLGLAPLTMGENGKLVFDYSAYVLTAAFGAGETIQLTGETDELAEGKIEFIKPSTSSKYHGSLVRYDANLGEYIAFIGPDHEPQTVYLAPCNFGNYTEVGLDQEFTTKSIAMNGDTVAFTEDGEYTISRTEAVVGFDLNGKTVSIASSTLDPVIIAGDGYLTGGNSSVNISIADGVTVTAVDGATYGAVSGAGTLVVPEGVTVHLSNASANLSGSGTIAYHAGTVPESKSKLKAEAWTGTARFTGCTFAGANPGEYGNANSTVELMGCSGYLEVASLTIAPAIKFTDDPDSGNPGLKITASSTKTYTFNKITGTGTFQLQQGGDGQALFIIKDMSAFEGAIKLVAPTGTGYQNVLVSAVETSLPSGFGTANGRIVFASDATLSMKDGMTLTSVSGTYFAGSRLNIAGGSIVGGFVLAVPETRDQPVVNFATTDSELSVAGGNAVWLMTTETTGEGTEATTTVTHTIGSGADVPFLLNGAEAPKYKINVGPARIDIRPKYGFYINLR
ncbi:MAG: autotransporter-associated beta strand repeat-containing protein [Kiritimatiellae bacterium]|nr:autotransporter-associated beta strand repeat-containing protein [Kiritimatiellia bacterium]